jgi:hypothetical protein
VKRCKCGATADYQCDYEVPSRRSGTCDAYICNACRTEVAIGTDYCNGHASAWSQHQAQGALNIT